MAKDVKELMAEAGVNEELVDAARTTDSVFLSYVINGRPVHVEIIAPNLAETLLKLPTSTQASMIAVALNFVPEVGDHEVLVDDHGNGKKHRGARIIRIRSDSDEEINLLITR
jgi:hypothetical protein